MPKKILAPHREQEGWAYWRVRVTTAKSAANAQAVNPLWLVNKDTLECVKASDICLGVGYSDDTPGSRIISSRRVEEAVETADFLKLCDEEGLTAQRSHVLKKWLVWSSFDSPSGVCDTLREAYYRYKAEAELDAQQPGPFGDETEPVDDARFCCHCAHLYQGSSSDPCASCIEHGYDDNGDWARPNFVRAAR